MIVRYRNTFGTGDFKYAEQRRKDGQKYVTFKNRPFVFGNMCIGTVLYFLYLCTFRIVFCQHK